MRADDHTKARRRLSGLQGIDPMIGVGCTQIVTISTDNTRKTNEDPRRDLREVTRGIRPDWDLAVHGRSPSAADSPSAAAVPGGA